MAISCTRVPCGLLSPDQLLGQSLYLQGQCPWQFRQSGFSSQSGPTKRACVNVCTRMSIPFKYNRREGSSKKDTMVVRSMRVTPSPSTELREDTGSSVNPGGHVNSLDRPPDKTLPPNREGALLLYRPYLQFVWDTLMDSDLAPQDEPMPAGLELRKGSAGSKHAEVHSWLLRAARLRRVRLTYFIGDTCQAFNCVFYPEHRYNLPLLGIDLLFFANGKILWVVDFQPLSQAPDYLAAHTGGLTNTFAEVREMCGNMTERFFDPTKFVSEKMIFFRSSLGSDEPALQVPDGKLYIAYTEYVREYMRHLTEAEPLADDAEVTAVAQAQTEYDEYFCQRDPAAGLFNTYFGKEWSHRYFHEFLFPEATTGGDHP